jgi:hypothetical protein
MEQKLKKCDGVYIKFRVFGVHGKLRGAETQSKVSNTVKVDLGLSEVLKKILNVNVCDREGFYGYL